MSKPIEAFLERIKSYILTYGSWRFEWPETRNHIVHLLKESAKSFHQGFQLCLLAGATLRLYLWKEAMCYVVVKFYRVVQSPRAQSASHPPNARLQRRAAFARPLEGVVSR